MRRLALLALPLALVACGDQPVPERGTITDARYSPAWVQIVPMTCSGNPPICTGPFIIPHSEEWRLEVTDLNNPDWVGTVAVNRSVYEHCNLRELWPECSREGSGDERVDSKGNPE